MRLRQRQELQLLAGPSEHLSATSGAQLRRVSCSCHIAGHQLLALGVAQRLVKCRMHFSDALDGKTFANVMHRLAPGGQELGVEPVQMIGRQVLQRQLAERRQYNPDFIVIETDGTHWIVVVKMDKEVESEDVQASEMPPGDGRTM